MLRPLYGFAWPYGYVDNRVDNDAGRVNMESLIAIYAIADKYSIPQLKEETRQEAMISSTRSIEHEEISSSAVITKLIYSSTPATDHGLSNTQAAHVARNAKAFYLAEHAQVITDLARDFPEFLQDLAKLVAKGKKVNI